MVACVLATCWSGAAWGQELAPGPPNALVATRPSAPAEPLLPPLADRPGLPGAADPGLAATQPSVVVRTFRFTGNRAVREANIAADGCRILIGGTTRD